MSPYCRYQEDSCPAGGSSARSGDTSIRAGGEVTGDPKSSSKPESLSLDMRVCFRCRVVCRCWFGESASVRLLLWTLSLCTKETMSVLEPVYRSATSPLAEYHWGWVCVLDVEGTFVWWRKFPGVSPAPAAHLSPVTKATEAKPGANYSQPYVVARSVVWRLISSKKKAQ